MLSTQILNSKHLRESPRKLLHYTSNSRYDHFICFFKTLRRLKRRKRS